MHTSKRVNGHTYLRFAKFYGGNFAINRRQQQ